VDKSTPKEVQSLKINIDNINNILSEKDDSTILVEGVKNINSMTRKKTFIDW